MKKISAIFFLIFLSLGSVNAQWVSVHDYANNPVEGFADNGNILYAALAGTGVYRTSNNGINWILTNYGITTQPFNNIAAKDSLVFVSSNLGLFRSTNYGLSFDSLTSIIGTVYNVYIVNNFVFAGKMNGIYRSSDWGATWININNEIPVNNCDVKSFAYSNGYLYSGIDSIARIRIFRSSNFGNNWTCVSQDITQNGIPYSLFTIDNIVLCGTASGVYKSTNYGANWALIPGIPGNIGLFGFASSGSKDIFISAWNSGVFVSNDYGQTFGLKNEGLINALQCTALHKFGNYLFLGTNPYSISCTIFRRQTNEVVGINNISTEIPDNFKLYQNYPNPFNPTTNIKYSVKRESSNVKIVVYDIRGKSIATIVNEKQKPGTYEVNFDGGNLSSGMYFYGLIVDGIKIDTKKMMLVK